LGGLGWLGRLPHHVGFHRAHAGVLWHSALSKLETPAPAVGAGTGVGVGAYPVLRQYQQITERLEGEPMEAIFRLYEPENVVDDIDGYTGATLRGAKVISAFRDGLNRGVYSW
jgi:hypothetical protein